MIISPNDPKSYRYTTLPNGLDTLLISDSDTDKSSAALAVNVGHFDDPVNVQGLAHLLEHMMFLGTEQFPDASEYQQFIKSHGGHHNAWTGSEHTNYYFAINNKFFEQALERFSDFFVQPLLDNAWINKEINAVESEYQLKYRDENRRFLSVLKEITNPQHPFAKFSVGNKETFSQAGDDIGNTLRAFYQSHYCAGKMKLVLLSNHSLDELEVIANNYFSAITNNNLTTNYPEQPLYQEQEQSLAINIQPERDIKKLHLNFSMPHQLINYHNKPLSYIGYLLGHEGDGSLLSYLKSQGLVNALSAGTGLQGYNYTEFSISVALTDLGISEIDQVIGLIFHQINLVRKKGIEAWRYLEKHSLVKTAFDFQEPVSPSSLTSHLATNLFNYAPEDVIYGDYSLDRYEPEAIDACLAQMRPDNARVILISLNVDTDQTSTWYDTPYKITPIGSARQQQWQDVASQPLESKIYLPSANPFVIERLSYRPTNSLQTIPKVLLQKPGFRLWHMNENKFKVPKGHIYTAIDSAVVGDTARSAALCRLYVELLHDTLAELTYPAELAGMHYDIYPHQTGFTLHVSGFTPKLFLYFDMLIAKIGLRSYSTKRFSEIKQQLITNWKNTVKAKPINRLFSQLSTALQPKQFDADTLAAEMESIDMPQLMAFNQALYEDVHLESYVHGDWDNAEVAVFADSIYHQVSTLARPKLPSVKHLISLENTGTNHISVSSNHDDSSIIIYYQALMTSPETTALFSLFNQLISPFYFQRIRTEQQLGYLCGCSYMPVHRHPGLILYIQSPVEGPKGLLGAIDEVLSDFKQHLAGLDDSAWQTALTGLVNQISTPDKTQQSAVQRFWISIGNQDTTFSHQHLTIDAIKALNKTQLIRFLETTLLGDNGDRLILTTSSNKLAIDDASLNLNQITDLKQFKAQATKIKLGPN